MMLTMDPPRHTALRSLVSEGFTPRQVARLNTHIADTARQIRRRGGAGRMRLRQRHRRGAAVIGDHITAGHSPGRRSPALRADGDHRRPEPPPGLRRRRHPFLPRREPRPGRGRRDRARSAVAHEGPGTRRAGRTGALNTHEWHPVDARPLHRGGRRGSLAARLSGSRFPRRWGIRLR
jgi:hypothetical protein